MGEKRGSDPWLEDFSYVLSRDTMRRERSDYKYEVFAGSKLIAPRKSKAGNGPDAWRTSAPTW